MFKAGRKLHPICYQLSSVARDAFFTSLSSVLCYESVQLT